MLRLLLLVTLNRCLKAGKEFFLQAFLHFGEGF